MVKRKGRRTPLGYDGTELTTHQIGYLLPKVFSRISAVHKERPDLVLAVWPEIIGQKLASMTEAVSFIEGILTVRVKNSTLHSLLSQNDKPRILRSLRQKFPNIPIRGIAFRIG